MVVSDRPKVEKKQKRALTPDEVKQLLATVRGHRLEWLYHIAVTLGLRKGELVNLRWADLALDSSPPTLTVQRGKTPAARRTIALSPELVDGLRQHWRNQATLRAAKDVEWKEHTYVFPSEVGTKTSERNLDRHFKSALQAAGLPDVPFHWLRHTALTRLAEANTPPAVLQAIAGHTKFSTTAEIYVHVATDQQQECIAKMSALYA
jgi:integrase